MIKFSDEGLEAFDLKVCKGCSNKMKVWLNQCHMCLTYQDGTQAIFSDPDMEEARLEKHNSKYKVQV